MTYWSETPKTYFLTTRLITTPMSEGTACFVFVFIILDFAKHFFIDLSLCDPVHDLETVGGTWAINFISCSAQLIMKF